MIDLDRELRALLEEDAHDAPPAPEADPAIRRARRRQGRAVLTLLAIVAAIAVGSIAGASALLRTAERRVPAEPNRPLAFVCPHGSAPDAPGPVDQVRPNPGISAGSMAFDRGSGRMVLLTDGGSAWTFDVCTNTWTAASAMPAQGPRNAAQAKLVYDVDSDLTVAIGLEESGLWVQTYDLERDAWTPRSPLGTAQRPAPPQAVYDPVTGLIIVRDPSTALMWTYDVETDAWAEIDRAVPTFGILGPPMQQLLTYDASVDRLILYVNARDTWRFDLRTGRWTEDATETPELGFGWFPSGDEMTYDEANEVSFLFSGGTAVAYRASAMRWQVLFGGEGIADAPDGPLTRLGFASAYDPANERIVVAGGEFRMHGPGPLWRAADDVWAFDVATREWIQLLAPSAGT